MDSLGQCNQMARLFVQNLAIFWLFTTMKIWPTTEKWQRKLENCQILNKPSIIVKRLFKFCQIWSHCLNSTFILSPTLFAILYSYLTAWPKCSSSCANNGFTASWPVWPDVGMQNSPKVPKNSHNTFLP